MRDEIVEDERLLELDALDRPAFRAEPAGASDCVDVQRRDRRGDLGPRRSGDLRSPN
ncbi:MAG: hypothetical protein ACJ77D_05580 [Chloroflexota bacterium]